MAIKVFDCDNPQKPERDEPLGETAVELATLKEVDTHEFTEALSTKGKVVVEATWVPPAPDAEGSAKFAAGDERVVIGSKPLILREGFHKASRELLTV